MIAVLDTGFFIKRKLQEINFNEGYITSRVYNELKDEDTLSYYNLYSFKIKIVDPQEEFIQKVDLAIKNKNLLLSQTDIELIALSLELSENNSLEWITKENLKNQKDIICYSEDNGVLSALNLLNIPSHKLIKERKYKLRCYACFTMYEEEIDFCKKCGYNTISRVSVTENEEGTKLHLKKNYRYKNKELKSKDGVVIRSADQKEYFSYVKEKTRKEKKYERALLN